MVTAMNRFIEAHDRYMALNDARTGCTTPQQKELMHIQILRAYLEVQHRARTIAGLQFADGNDWVDEN